jgi:5'-nucleotidase
METKSKIKKLSQESEELLQERVTELKEGLSLSWFHPSPLAQVLSDGLREWCDAEISMINAGILLDELPKGLVTKKDLHRICPHPVNPCKVVVTGAQLKEIIHQAFTEEMQRLELKGLGFRGKLLGRMIFTGVKVTTEDLSDGLSHVRHIEVLGRPIDPQRKYVIATLDMFTFGFLYPEFKHAKEKHYYLPEMLRDVLGWTLMKL